MPNKTRLSEPYMSRTQPGRWGRDFHNEAVGFGRIEEAAPAYMEPDANAVSRVLVQFLDREDLAAIDPSTLRSESYDLGTFRRQIIHEDFMITLIDQCLTEALAAPTPTPASAPVPAAPVAS